MENFKPIIGAIQNEDREFYIERKSDLEAAINLQKGNYVSIIEPRQQGKTSLILALSRRNDLQDIIWVYIDVSTFDQTSAVAWYHSLYVRLTRLLESQLTGCPKAKPWTNPNEWRDYLVEIATAAMQSRRRLVIVFDEIAAVQFAGSNDFFAVLREVYSTRGAEPYFKHLSFLLAGTFVIKDLIPDRRASPFNISVRVRIEDFTKEELLKLAVKYGWAGLEAGELVGAIFDWTGGQPYLSHTMLHHLSSAQQRGIIAVQRMALAAEGVAEKLLASDTNNILPLRERLERLFALNPGNYRAKLESILAGNSFEYRPVTLPWQELFETAGIIKRGDDKRCQIRCRLYEKFLYSWLEIQENDRSAQIMDAKHRIFLRRLKDLEAHIDDLYRMLNDFEKHLFYNDDPRTSQKDRMEIEKIKEMIKDYLRELDAIETNLGKTPDVLANQTGAVEHKLTQLSQHLDRIELLVQPLTQAITADRISSKDQEEMLILVRAIYGQLPQPESEKIADILSAPEVGVSHKLKLSLPIVFPFLSYEGEIGIDEKMNLETLVSHIKEMLRERARKR